MIKTIARQLRRKPRPSTTPVLLDESREFAAATAQPEQPDWAIRSRRPQPPIVRLDLGERELGRADVIAEAMKVMQSLGIEPRGPLNAGDLVRLVYAQGWLACEARLASPDMADVIDAALNHPGRVTDRSSTDTINSWTVRALQQTIVRGSGNR